MATLVLGLAGTALGGTGVFAGISLFGGAITGATILGAVGGMIGGFLDQVFLTPLISGGPATIEGPRLDDIQIQLAAEGSDLPWGLGPEVRTSGILHYKQSPLKVVTTTTGGGGGGKGGGGGGVQLEKKTAFATFGVLLMEAETAVSKITWINLNDKRVYDFDDSPIFGGTITSSFIGLESQFPGSSWHPRADPLSEYPTIASYNLSVRLKSWDMVNADLSQYNSGDKVKVTGFHRTDFNINHDDIGVIANKSLVTKSGTGTGTSPFTGTTQPYSFIEYAMNTGTVILPWSSAELPADLEGAITVERINAANPDDIRYKNIEVFLGGDNANLPSTIIEADKGAGNVSRDVGTCGFILDELNLTDFGNTTPRASALVEVNASITVGQAIEKIIDRTGLASSFRDASAVTNPLRGIHSQGPQPAARLIEPLMLAFDVRVAEVMAQLVYTPKTSAVDFVIPYSRVGVGQAGQERPFGVKMIDKQDRAIADEVVVKFVDPDRDYQKGTRRERKIESKLRNVNAVDLPITMSSDTAGELALRLLWTGWSERIRAEFTVGPEYLEIRPGDLVTIQIDNEVYPIRLTSVLRGRTFEHECVGVIEKNLTFAPDIDNSDDGTPGGDGPLRLYEVDAFPFDGPALSETELLRIGYYCAFGTVEPLGVFRSVGLYDSGTQAGTYEYAGITYTNEATVGVAFGGTDDGLPFKDGPGGVWDEDNTFLVQLNKGTLSNATKEAVLDGANRALVGGELIAFRTATLVEGSTYRCSGLLRKLRDTHIAATSHTDGERFILLDESTLGFKQTPVSSLGTTKYVKGVPADTEIADAVEQSVALTGRTARPFSPGNIAATRDGSNNLTTTWVRRSRGFWRTMGQKIGIISSTETYMIEYLDGPGGTVVRTRTGLTTKTDTYTAADQTTDGLTPGNPVTMRLYREDQTFGESDYREVTL